MSQRLVYTIHTYHIIYPENVLSFLTDIHMIFQICFSFKTISYLFDNAKHEWWMSEIFRATFSTASGFKFNKQNTLLFKLNHDSSNQKPFGDWIKRDWIKHAETIEKFAVFFRVKIILKLRTFSVGWRIVRIAQWRAECMHTVESMQHSANFLRFITAHSTRTNFCKMSEKWSLRSVQKTIQKI